MRVVKYVLVPLFILAVFASCHKSSGVGPKTPIDTDALIHEIKFMPTAQYSGVSVSNTTLTIIYYENITLLIPAKGSELSWSIHLKEDFSSSALINYHYTTIDQAGDINHDWVDDNLNNVSAKTTKDTTVAGVSTVKITVQRPFTFSKAYTTNAAAIAGEDSILSRKSDIIKFSSYVLFTKIYPADSTSAAVYYIKTN